MKTASSMLIFVIISLCLLGCLGLPKYTGDGKLINTTAWEDNIARVPEYTIILNSFSLTTNVEEHFSLGNISFFRRTTISVFLRFTDSHYWRKYSEIGSSDQLRRLYKEKKVNNVDKLQARWICHVEAESGEQIFKFDKLIRDCVWSESHFDGSLKKVSVFDLANTHKEVPPDKKLTLAFSYLGDPTLTNNAELIVICRKKATH
jgi:hypothetical protein